MSIPKDNLHMALRDGGADSVVSDDNGSKVHPVLKWATPGYTASQILCIGIIPSTDFGQALAFPF
jgi:hypothetical protein